MHPDQTARRKVIQCINWLELHLRIAIIGSGISGLVCAYRLHQQHQVRVFEANDYIGGHTHTIETPTGDHVDTGFIVFNEENYPQFCKLLDELGVASQPTSMSFSGSCRQTGLEYSTASLNHLFAQRKNLVNPVFYELLRDIVRFNRQAPELAKQLSPQVTVRDFLQQQSYSQSFIRNFLYPISVALWSCPQETIDGFPMRFILEFYLHHGMHKLIGQPGWRVIQGGSQQYVRKLIRPFAHCIRTSCPVDKVERLAHEVRVHSRLGIENYDEVIFACHSDQALKILGQDARPVERELLSAFPYTRNAVTLHTDTTLLPRNRRAWASWNACIESKPATSARVTYHMNRLQRLNVPQQYCVTLNQYQRINPREVIARLEYDHPQFNVQRNNAQSRHQEVIRQHRTSFCGAYWGNGFHEAGVVSALAVCESFAFKPIPVQPVIRLQGNNAEQACSGYQPL